MFDLTPGFDTFEFLENHDYIPKFENEFPTLVMHGINDNCKTGGVDVFIAHIQKLNNIYGMNLHAECIEVGTLDEKYYNPF